jgi:uncharacterized membrane protein YtjA (UPF0391 family)
VASQRRPDAGDWEENGMLGGGLVGLAILFFVLALIFALLGVRGVAGMSMSVAKWLVIIFIVLAIISLLL